MKFSFPISDNWTETGLKQEIAAKTNASPDEFKLTIFRDKRADKSVFQCLTGCDLTSFDGYVAMAELEGSGEFLKKFVEIAYA